jgi:hypothetical protein
MIRPKTYVASAPMNATRPEVVSPTQRRIDWYDFRIAPDCIASRTESMRVRTEAPRVDPAPREAGADLRLKIFI